MPSIDGENAFNDLIEERSIDCQESELSENQRLQRICRNAIVREGEEISNEKQKWSSIFKIERLTIESYCDIVALWTRANLPFRPSGRESKRALTAQMKTSPDFFLGAYDNVRLVGVVFISCDGRKGWINRLAVDPKYRRRGIAKTLVARAEKILQEHKVEVFCALVKCSNMASRNLFQKSGYTQHNDILYFSKRMHDEA